MKKRILVLLLCIVGNLSIAKGQSNASLPQERVFVHVNASLFLAGETLFYKVYCLDGEINKLSTLSKMAYIELIGQDKDVVFKHKIKLESGIGYGDFAVPVAVASGNYKLIAYTQWMQNEGIESFYINDISIINPFQSDQDDILVDTNVDPSNQTDNLSNANSENLNLKKIESQFLEIETTQKEFQKRAKVSLTLKDKTKDNLSGNYSISVRKVDALDALATTKALAKDFVDQKVNLKQTINSVDFLPELRGELISGKLLRVSDNKPAPNEKVAMSIQQYDFILNISNTNQDGLFYFNVSEDYNKETAVIQVLEKDNKDFKIVIDKHDSNDYGNLEFATFKISSNYKNELEQRSIYNQIENGYFDLKANALQQIDTIQPFFGDYFETFYLDDYTRFNKVQETFVEVVKGAYIKRNANQKLNFYVISLNPYEQLEKPAGVIVDGILLQDFDEFLAYDSRKIKRVSIARVKNNFILGSKSFGGLIVIETIDGKFSDALPKDKLTMVNLLKPQLKKTYYKKNYTDSNTLNRIPDYRNQLLWEPNVHLKSQDMVIDFFTSDNTGTYEISIEGFTANGNPVSIRDIITVK